MFLVQFHFSPWEMWPDFVSLKFFLTWRLFSMRKYLIPLLRNLHRSKMMMPFQFWKEKQTRHFDLWMNALLTIDRLKIEYIFKSLVENIPRIKH